MFKKINWFNQFSSRPKNPLSLDHLRHLCNVMSKNIIVTEQNKTLLVETLRQIAEILIWGDQNDSSVFDFFLERNMLSFFLDIMKQKCGNYVTVQLLQTLNILFENIRHETSLYYLLSNNHVNSIIVHKFDLSDEEVMAYYISFLKTLSFKLNPHTIHFFFNTSDFPLYTEAVKYFNHPEKMVRIAVRILTLNVFKVEEKSMLKFITDQTVPCLRDLVQIIRDNVTNIEKSLKDNKFKQISNNKTSIKDTNNHSNHYNTGCITNIDDNEIANKNKNINDSPTGSIGKRTKVQASDKLLLKLEDLFAEHLDHLHYLNDIMMLRIDDINRILADNLMQHLIKPLVDAYQDDKSTSMIRLFTLEFTTATLSKVLATCLYEDDGDYTDDNPEEEEGMVINRNNIVNDRIANEVKDCDNQDDLCAYKLSRSQLVIVEQSKERAESAVKKLLKIDCPQQMTYLSLFETEYNDLKRKRLSTDYLLLDVTNDSSSSNRQRSSSSSDFSDSTSTTTNNTSSTTATTNNSERQPKSDRQSKSERQSVIDIDRARYQIRDFLLWRQFLLNIKNDKDRELSLKNTSWLSYAKLLQWLE